MIRRVDEGALPEEVGWQGAAARDVLSPLTGLGGLSGCEGGVRPTASGIGWPASSLHDERWVHAPLGKLVEGEHLARLVLCRKLVDQRPQRGR